MQTLANYFPEKENNNTWRCQYTYTFVRFDRKLSKLSKPVTCKELKYKCFHYSVITFFFNLRKEFMEKTKTNKYVSEKDNSLVVITNMK